VRRPEPGSWHPARDKGALQPPIARADHVKHPDGGDSRERAREKKHPRWHPRKHPRAERIIPKSRDFH
jgi:error-prone DNA polymerase